MKIKNDWQMPSLKEAQKRTTQQALIEKSLFNIPAEAKNIGVGR